MKKNIIISILLIFTISCSSNEPEEIYITFENFNVSARAFEIPNTDSVMVRVDFSLEYNFIKCRGFIEMYWKSFIYETGRGGPIETLSFPGKNNWHDGYDKKYKKPIPDKYIQGVWFLGRIYKDQSQNYEEFEELIEKEVTFRKNY